MDTLPVVDWSPFNEGDVGKLGRVKNWPELQRILGPLASWEFGVTDSTSLGLLIDEVRFTLDSTMSTSRDSASSKSRNIVALVAASMSLKDNPLQALEPLLAVGADPDVPDEEGWRASHNCGWLGHLDAASLLFLCRPDMTAKNNARKTPQQVVESTYKCDVQRPERRPLRKYVAKFIKDGGFVTGFPTLVELAVQRKLIPMKNLLRRQVVNEAEFTELSGEKTAAEWMDYFKEPLLAKEIRYYQQPVSARFRAAASELLQVTREKSSFDKKVKQLKAEVQDGKEKIAELSETVSAVLSSNEEGEKESEGVVPPAKKARVSPSKDVKDKTT